MLSCWFVGYLVGWLVGWLVDWVVGLTMANNVGWAPLVLVLICASAYVPMLRQEWSNNGPTRSNISENNRNVQRMLGESICMSDNIHILGSVSSVMDRVRVVLRKTVVGDWPFDHLSDSHLQSLHQMMAFMPLLVFFDWSVSSWGDWLSSPRSCRDW